MTHRLVRTNTFYFILLLFSSHKFFDGVYSFTIIPSAKSRGYWKYKHSRKLTPNMKCKLFEHVLEEIIIKSLDPLRAKKTFIRKKLGRTMVSVIKASSVTLYFWQKEPEENTVNFNNGSRLKD